MQVLGNSCGLFVKGKKAIVALILFPSIATTSCIAVAFATFISMRLRFVHITLRGGFQAINFGNIILFSIFGSIGKVGQRLLRLAALPTTLTEAFYFPHVSHHWRRRRSRSRPSRRCIGSVHLHLFLGVIDLHITQFLASAGHVYNALRGGGVVRRYDTDIATTTVTTGNVLVGTIVAVIVSATGERHLWRHAAPSTGVRRRRYHRPTVAISTTTVMGRPTRRGPVHCLEHHLVIVTVMRTLPASVGVGGRRRRGQGEEGLVVAAAIGALRLLLLFLTLLATALARSCRRQRGFG